MHRKYIPIYIPNKMQIYTVYLYLETALHVSGGTSTHHQERIQLYLQHLVFVTPLLLLPAAIVEELELVWVCKYQCDGYRVCFVGVKRPRRGTDHLPPHLVPGLKKEWSYTSTSRLSLRGLFWGESYLYLYLYIYIYLHIYIYLYIYINLYIYT